MTVSIRDFRPSDQQAARALIIEGLGGHFGYIDETMNPDLDDIQVSYVDTGGHFVIAEFEGKMAGTGALILEEPGIGRLVRMSVSPVFRGKGIGRALVNHLLNEARTRGYHQVVCETNHDWHDAIGLYLSCGFTETGIINGDRHFALTLIPVQTEEIGNGK